MSSKSSDYHAKLNVMQTAQSNVKIINEVRQAEAQEEKIRREDEDPQLIGEAKTAMTDVLDMNTISSDKISLEDRVAMLNDDQRRIFEKIKAHLLYRQQHKTDQCSCQFKLLQMFVSSVETLL